MASVLGLEARSYFNTGTMAAPVWDEIGPVKEETVNMEMGLADITTRLANGFRLQRGTLIEGSIDLAILYDTGNADFTTIQQAFFNRTQLLAAFLDGDVTQSGTYQGLHSAVNVTNFSQPRPLEDAIVVDVTFVLDVESGTDTAPTWATIVTP